MSRRMSFDCLDGRHVACAESGGCACFCHPVMPWGPAPIRDHLLAGLGAVVGMLALVLVVVAWVVFA